jgi:hypothetical protein
VTTTYGTLSTIAGFPVEVRLSRRAASSPRASGFVASRTLRANVSRQTNQPQTRAWSLTFGPENFTALLAAFDAAKGAALPLSWTPPPPDDGAAIPVRFVQDSLRVQHGPGPLYSAEVELEEVP